MNNKTILVIEDEQMILNNICTILQISGFNFIKAGNGVEALTLLKTAKPDLILCDVMMPGMNGFEVLEKIKSESNLSQIPFCFLSARADITDINKGLELGAKGYVTKPFTAKDLIETVSKFS